MLKRTLPLLGVLLLLVLFVAACGPAQTEEPQPGEPPVAEPTSPPEAEPEEAEPVILRVGGAQGPDCMNPFGCSTHWYWNYLAYEGFFGGGPRCDTFPRLAKSWEVSDDGLTWTMHLQENARFTDGTPFTAQVAADYMNWFRSTSLKEWYYEALYATDVKALDDYTVQLSLEVPVMTFPKYNGRWWWILPPAIYSKLTEDTIYSFEDLPNGTGPYDLVEFKPGEYLIYEAKPDYYLGKPPVDRIVYQIYANWDGAIQALIGGDIDLTFSDTPTQYIPALEGQPNIAVERRPPGDITALTFNVYKGGNKHPAIEDPLLREAIDYAIDKQKMLDVGLEGYGMLCPTNWACGPNFEDELNPDLKVTPYDPAKANQILDEAGYKDTDGDGVRETADEKPLDFRLYIDVAASEDLTMADLTKEMLSAVGITTTITSIEAGTLWQTQLGERDFDMVLADVSTDYDAAYLDYVASCWSADAGVSALNVSGYCSEELDELVYKYMTTPVREEAMGYIFEAQAKLNRERPYIFLAAPDIVEVYRTDRFNFPAPGESCDMNPGYWDWPLILSVTPK
jgi:peptide/nickel transport system substrate-binding protein